MVEPTSERTDNTVAVITLGLDGRNTGVWKKFKCSVCGGTVFRYKDTLTFELPIDTSEYYGDEQFESAEALDSVECTHFVYSKGNRRVRCQTTYILLRGNFNIVKEKTVDG